MPPPVPPSVNDGRMMAGSPISSSASSAWISVLICLERGVSRPMRVHRLAEQLAVLGLVDGVRGGADHLHVELLQHAHLVERQRGVERGLAAHGGKQGESAGTTCRSFSMILATISGVIGSI